MSPSVYITTRVVKSGKRYVVRYRLGGRTSKLRHAGSFTKRALAQTRRDLVAGELAAGRDPAILLRALEAAPKPATFLERYDAFIASRVDVSTKTAAAYRAARGQLRELANRDPAELAAADFQLWIADVSQGEDALAPATVKHYLGTHRQVLDFCEIEPNPARSKLIKLPSGETGEVEFPDNAEWARIKAQLGKRVRLPLRLMEACGLRIGEAALLTFGDVDFGEGRLRVSRARTKGRTAGQRWIPVPAELLTELDALCPLEDRTRERSVFGMSHWTIRRGMERACRNAKTFDYHPHSLRHRRCSLWLAHGLETVLVKRWSGHSKASELTDTYGHVVTEPDGDEWKDFWLDAYAAERSPKRPGRLPGEVPVRSERARRP